MASASRQIILASSDDWDEWIQVIKTVAEAKDIWEYVDPNREALLEMTEPQEPDPSKIKTNATSIADLDEPGREIYRYQWRKYERDLEFHDSKVRAVRDLKSFIQQTVSRDNLHYTYNGNAHDILVALKKRFAPTTRYRELEIIRKWKAHPHSLCQSNIDNWLTTWDLLYDKGKALNIPDFQDNRPTTDFMLAVKSLIPGFYSHWFGRLQDDLSCIGFHDLVQKFREWRQAEISDSHNQHDISFVTLKGRSPEGKQPNQPGSRSSNQLQEPRTCICGIQHRFSECPYIIESIRPNGWSPDPKIDEKWKNLLQSNWKIKKAVKKACQYIEQKASNSELPKEASQSSNQDSSYGITFATTKASYSTWDSPHPLCDSFILDSASNIHVCNVRDRFKDFRPAGSDNMVKVGDTMTKIEGYGTVALKVVSPDGKPLNMTLLNVAYSPGFHTNLVSYFRMRKIGISWDPNGDYLIYQGKHICQLQLRHENWTIEYNPIHTSFATRTSIKPLESAAPIELWHQRLGHLNYDALEHLPEATEGVKITTKRSISQPPSVCEVCAISTAKRQISRRPADRATQPYEKVHFDLINMEEAYNGDKWVAHYLCDASREHHVDTFPHKSDLLDSIRGFQHRIWTQYRVRVKVYHIDKEQTLGNEWNAMIKAQGTIIEDTVPYTPEQNGAAERAGGVIIQKARALLIEARLPLNLWPEAVRTAVYLINRSPTRSLGWITPREMIQKLTGEHVKRPNLANLRVYGSRAYVRDPKIP